MRADDYVATRVTVSNNAPGTLVSPFNAKKVYTTFHTNVANTQAVFIDGVTGVTTSTGFGGLVADKYLTLEGRGEVWMIAATSPQVVEVLTALDRG